MKQMKTVLWTALSVAAVLFALSLGSPSRSVQAQSVPSKTWCNTYLDPDWLPKDVPTMHETPPEPEWLKVKYGKGMMVNYYNALDSFKWWADFIIAPADARDKEVMYFYPVAAMTDDVMSEIVAQIASESGQTKPLFAMAAAPAVLDQWGVKIAEAEEVDMLAAPVWWNSKLAGTMQAAANNYLTAPEQTKRELAHFVSYTVATSLMYDADTELCNPEHSPNLKFGEFSTDEPTLETVYMGFNRPIKGLEAKAKRAVVKMRYWPKKD